MLGKKLALIGGSILVLALGSGIGYKLVTGRCPIADCCPFNAQEVKAPANPSN